MVYLYSQHILYISYCSQSIRFFFRFGHESKRFQTKFLGDYNKAVGVSRLCGFIYELEKARNLCSDSFINWKDFSLIL